MKKVWLFPLVSLVWLFFGLPAKVGADEPKINKFGIHILQPADLERASELVNSSGGDWGWVTVVIRDDERNPEKWQNFMDEARQSHLIPLVRLATHLEKDIWVKPQKEDAPKWANFLANLNWPVEDRYVIIFNEPNQAKEWGGEVNPGEYAQILEEFARALKAKNEKFKILPAGLDLAAPNSGETMDAYNFLQGMNLAVPGFFENLDGWVSHSYPNHGFRGKPWEWGKTSVRGYEWELAQLKNNFKLKKDLPVFITETGWPADDGILKRFYDRKLGSEYLKLAFDNVWLKDDRVLAITPFVLNDTGIFAQFSFLDLEGQPHLQFETIKNLPKTSWWPKQETKYTLESISLPPFLPTEGYFQGSLVLKNIGQSIWGEKGTFKIAAKPTEIAVSDLVLPPGVTVKPNETAMVNFSLTTSTISGEFEFSWEGLPNYKLKVFPPSIFTEVKYNFWERLILKVKKTIF